jgi:hypothetical protein
VVIWLVPYAHKIISKKGQVALEAAFVVLFIVIAVGGIVLKTIDFSRQTEIMSTARTVAQQVAFELSMNGTTTHLIRIDSNNLTEGTVDLYVMSEGCRSAYPIVKQKFKDALGVNTVNDFECEHELYQDTKFNT